MGIRENTGIGGCKDGMILGLSLIDPVKGLMCFNKGTVIVSFEKVHSGCRVENRLEITHEEE